MTQWEYKRFRVESDDGTDMVEWLNTLGIEEWELVSAPVLTQSGIVVWAKRPLE